MAVKKNQKYAVVDEKYCVGCGSCIKVCPKDAISVPNGVYAEIDLEKCIGCGLCARICPASVIDVMTKHMEGKEAS